jgi:hypothetical protein
MADDIKLENYKKNVARILDIWGDEAAAVAKELTPIESELKKLSQNGSPGDDDKKRIDELKKKCADLHKRLEKANMELRVNFMGIDVPPKADEKELVKIPPWVKDIIKRKGLPLGKEVSIAPTVDFDVKSKKVKSFGLKITW